MEVTGSTPVRSTNKSYDLWRKLSNVEGQSQWVVLFFFPVTNTSAIRQFPVIPTQIKLTVDQNTQTDILLLAWDDGHSGATSLRTLRDNCPCAGCQGETVLLKTYAPMETPEMPGKYKLVGAQQVGLYALSLSWADGHQTGIYTWQHLRGLCECESCRSQNERK